MRDIAARLRQGTRKPTNPNTFGPRQPNLVGVGASPASPPVAASKAGQSASAAAVAGAKADALAQYVAGITDPQERAYVEAQIGPQIVALNAQRDAYEAQSKARQQAEQGLTQALVAQIGGIATQMGVPYGEIANSQVAAGKAAGEALAAANPGDKTEALLRAIGAPESQLQSLEKLGRDVFTGGGAVLTGTGGTLPSFQTAGEGVGVLGYAAAQPTIAAGYGQENMRQLLAEQAQQESQYQTDLQSILAGIPKARMDYASQQASAEKGVEDRAISLYNAGLITQREWARQSGIPGWQKYPDTTRGSQAAPKVLKVGNNIVAVDPTTGKTTLVYQAPPDVPAPKGMQHVTIGQNVYSFDPNTGRYLDPRTGRPVVPTVPQKQGKAPGPTKVSMPLSRALGVWVDGQGVPIPALRNAPAPTPTSGFKPSAKASTAKLGSAPRLVHGQWRTRAGKTLTGPTAEYWDSLYRAGFTDGRGHIVKPVPRGYKPGQSDDSGGGLLGPKADAATKKAAYTPQAVQALQLIREYLGTDYKWGGTTPAGFDCSGLLQFVWAKVGVSIPRTTFTQWRAGYAVPESQLQPGDAVFFVGSDGSRSNPGHVGMYIGDGQFIEAPGEHARGGKVRISSLASRSDYVGARRFTGNGSYA
ncbi:MAG TPA: NlpC/P60 family protein [Gemmataceae bacterium]